MSVPTGSRRRIIIFARAPQRGRVKTRLAADLDSDAALVIYRWLAERTLAAARAVPACETEVRYTPSDAAAEMTCWLGTDVALRPQGEGDLGSRMLDAVADAFAQGVGAVVVIGTDCPTLDTRDIARAFELLDHADVVIGPATDGGYYLIAMRAAHPVLFDGIPWSSSATFTQTIAAADTEGLIVSLLAERSDVDTLADWQRWLSRVTEVSRVPAGAPRRHA